MSPSSDNGAPPSGPPPPPGLGFVDRRGFRAWVDPEGVLRSTAPRIVIRRHRVERVVERELGANGWDFARTLLWVALVVRLWTWTDWAALRELVELLAAGGGS